MTEEQNMLDREMIHIQGRMEPDPVRLLHTTQKNAQFKTRIVSEIIHLMFFRLQLTSGN